MYSICLFFSPARYLKDFSCLSRPSVSWPFTNHSLKVAFILIGGMSGKSISHFVGRALSHPLFQSGFLWLHPFGSMQPGRAPVHPRSSPRGRNRTWETRRGINLLLHCALSEYLTRAGTMCLWNLPARRYLWITQHTCHNCTICNNIESRRYLVSAQLPAHSGFVVPTGGGPLTIWWVTASDGVRQAQIFIFVRSVFDLPLWYVFISFHSLCLWPRMC